MKKKLLRKRMIVACIIIAMVITFLPFTSTEAAVKKLSDSDFVWKVKTEKGSYNYEEGRFVAKGSKWVENDYFSGDYSYWGTFPKVNDEIPNTQSFASQCGYTAEGWDLDFQTSRAIKKNSTRKQVEKAYGKGKVIKRKNDKFLNLYQNTKTTIYENIAAMDRYSYAISYQYKKNKNIYEIRFYFDKNNKCKGLLMANNLSDYLKNTTKKSGLKMTISNTVKKKISGHNVIVYNDDSVINIQNNNNIYDAEILYYNKKGKLIGRFGESVVYDNKYEGGLEFCDPKTVDFWEGEEIQQKIIDDYAYTKIVITKFTKKNGKTYLYKPDVYYVSH